jgi:hypothetical protein
VKPPITVPPAQKEPVEPEIDPCLGLATRISGLEEQISGVSFELDSRAGQAESSVIEILGKFDLFDGKLLGAEKKTEDRFSLLLDAGRKSYQANEKQNSAISSLSSGQNSLGTYVGLAALLGLTGPAGLAAGAAGWIAIRRLKKRIKAKDQGPNESRQRIIHDLRTTLAQNKVDRQREIDNTDCDGELLRREQENLHLRNEKDEYLRQITKLTRQVEKTENHYVRVPVTDGEAEAYKEACRKVVRQYPNYEQVVKLVEGIADQIHHGQKVAQE